MVDSKENYKFDPGVKGLIHFGEQTKKRNSMFNIYCFNM